MAGENHAFLREGGGRGPGEKWNDTSTRSSNRDPLSTPSAALSFEGGLGREEKGREGEGKGARNPRVEKSRITFSQELQTPNMYAKHTQVIKTDLQTDVV